MQDRNYLRFRKVLAEAHSKPQTLITNLGNLLPQSYCTRLRQAYQYAIAHQYLPAEPKLVFNWTPVSVTIRHKNHTIEPESFEATTQQPRTIHLNFDDVQPRNMRVIIDELMHLASHSIFPTELEIPGQRPPDVSVHNTTQLVNSWLIH